MSFVQEDEGAAGIAVASVPGLLHTTILASSTTAAVAAAVAAEVVAAKVAVVVAAVKVTVAAVVGEEWRRRQWQSCWQRLRWRRRSSGSGSVLLVFPDEHTHTHTHTCIHAFASNDTHRKMKAQCVDIVWDLLHPQAGRWHKNGWKQRQVRIV